MPVAEEAVAANAVSDGDDQPPQIPRYERTVPEQMQQRPTQSMRQMYNMTGSGQQMMRTIPAPSSGPKGNFIFLKTAEGAQKMVVRPSGPGQSVASSSAPNMVDQQVYRTSQDYPPGTVLNSSGTRLVAVRAAPQQQQQQQFRQMYTAGNGPRYVRIQNASGPSRPDQVVRRVIPTASQQRLMVNNSHLSFCVAIVYSVPGLRRRSRHATSTNALRSSGQSHATEDLAC